MVVLLHVVSLAAESVLLAVNVMHTISTSVASRETGETSKLWDDIAFLTVSFMFTVASFFLNLLGASSVLSFCSWHRPSHSTAQCLGRDTLLPSIKPLFRAIRLRGWHSTIVWDCGPHSMILV